MTCPALVQERRCGWNQTLQLKSCFSSFLGPVFSFRNGGENTCFLSYGSSEAPRPRHTLCMGLSPEAFSSSAVLVTLPLLGA
jgi:hypothetical protein